MDDSECCRTMWMYLVSLNCTVNMLKIAHFHHKTFTTVKKKKKVKKHVFMCIMVYEGFFWKILLQLLPINKQRPKSKCLCKTGTKFLRMKLHLVLKWSPQRCLFLLFPASPYQERQTEKANEHLSPHSLRQWKGAPVSNAANLGGLKGRMAPCPSF